MPDIFEEIIKRDSTTQVVVESGSAPTGTYFTIDKNLAEGDPSDMRGNLGLSETDDVTFKTVTLQDGIIKSDSPARVEDLNGNLQRLNIADPTLDDHAVTKGYANSNFDNYQNWRLHNGDINDPIDSVPKDFQVTLQSGDNIQVERVGQANYRFNFTGTTTNNFLNGIEWDGDAAAQPSPDLIFSRSGLSPINFSIWSQVDTYLSSTYGLNQELKSMAFENTSSYYTRTHIDQNFDNYQQWRFSDGTISEPEPVSEDMQFTLKGGNDINLIRENNLQYRIDFAGQTSGNDYLTGVEWRDGLDNTSGWIRFIVSGQTNPEFDLFSSSRLDTRYYTQSVADSRFVRDSDNVTWTGEHEFRRNTGGADPIATFQRTDNQNNAVLAFESSDSIVYAGVGTSNRFQVGGEANLNSGDPDNLWASFGPNGAVINHALRVQGNLTVEDRFSYLGMTSRSNRENGLILQRDGFNPWYITSGFGNFQIGNDAQAIFSIDDSTGIVAINEADPTTSGGSFQVHADGASDSIQMFRDNIMWGFRITQPGSDQRWNLRFNEDIDIIRVGNDGKVGILTQADHELDVNGTIRAQGGLILPTKFPGE